MLVTATIGQVSFVKFMVFDQQYSGMKSVIEAQPELIKGGCEYGLYI
jgi:hypothetical protein